MHLYVHKDFFRLPFHLKLVDGKLQKTEELGLAVGTKEFNTFAKLYLLKLPQFPPENFLKAYKSILRNTNAYTLPWNQCIPQEFYIDYIKIFGAKLHEQTKNIDTSYFEQYFQKGNLILNALQEAKINKEFFESYKDNAIASTFLPNEEGYAEVPEYSRVDTVSGRLKVISGPNILHLKKEYRNIITSRFGEDGAIFYLDFKSLEPRLTITFNSSCGTLPKDIYEEIHSRITKDITVTREQIKLAVISEMYGVGLNTLKEQLPNFSENDLLILTGIVRDYLGIIPLKEKLIEEYERNNKLFIKNLYQRYVSTVDIASYALINRLVQSSAVDVALMGFGNIVTYIEEMSWKEFIVPLFVLHDALILDIHKNHFNTIPTLCKIGAIDIPLLEKFNFYLKAEKII